MSNPIDGRIATLPDLDRPALCRLWEETFGYPAPKHISRDLLLGALAYRVQEQAQGGLGKAARKRLAQTKGKDERPPRPAAPRLRPGTHLVREWRGRVHRVTVLDQGFDYDGSRYASLSQIARRITGTRWSGPLFFGLRRTEASTDDR
ncbi:MAG TPA: DUF2924 domain-containing protein [Bradyrhizobium sp.]|nr:DUF2924 domain-containing protein [Bradyrhizobium sp.]